MTVNKSENSIENCTCGAWRSPITSDAIVQSANSIDELRLVGSTLYWIERRPTESGRCVVVTCADEQQHDLLPAPYSCRSRVHEYGGGSFCITESALFFVNDSDQNIYRLANNQIECILDAPDLRFADLVFDFRRNQLICVCEDHSIVDKEPVNTLVAINIDNASIHTLNAGHDFYASPCFNSDFSQLAWLSWDHPDMPWDSTQLWLADVNSTGTLDNKKCITNTNKISVFQPRWSPDDLLYYISDQSGWWNIYRYNKGDTQAITHEQLEFGLPHWVFGQSAYAFINKNTIIASYINNGEAAIAYIDIASGAMTPLLNKWSSYSSIQCSNNKYYFIAQSQTDAPQIIKHSMNNNNNQSIKISNNLLFDERYLSCGQSIQYKTRHDDLAYAIYYPPTNPDCAVTEDEKPPLIVITHGGPTAASNSAYDSRKQFWTSRGFAVLDVNYSGSTGFGRDYRQRLNGQWGVRDAEDCCDAALYMVDQGLVDANRLIIKGSSAGGYTVLCALTFHQVFSAGASYYGISELTSLASDTHKFEARYLDRLIGPYPQAIEIYQQRSPIFHVDQLNCPVIFFQGLEDRVVPKEQAEKMFAALVNKGIATAYISFEGEQHGFRKAETLKQCLDAELSFYATIFDIPVENKMPLDIKNIG